jgi:hypothetical protein
MANDTPFIDLPSPPRDDQQPTSAADIRGWDFDDEYVRATNYQKSINARVRSRLSFLNLLKGSPAAYRELQRKSLPLAESSPPYIEGD